MINFASCNSFSFKTIYNYSHDECIWLQDDKEIPCDSEELRNKMLIDIEEYLEFKNDYVCTEVSKVDNRKRNSKRKKSTSRIGE